MKEKAFGRRTLVSIALVLILILALGLTVTLAGCGGKGASTGQQQGQNSAAPGQQQGQNPPTPEQKVTLNGAGASFPYPLYSKWFEEYRKVKPNVTINYQSIGSGG